jgi:hypothetical protein
MSTSVTHRSLDGRRFTLGGALDLAAPVTSVVGVTVRGRLHELTSGSAALGAEVAATLGVGRFTEELGHRGGTLLVGRARPYDRQTRLVEDLVLAVWRGREHSLVTTFHGVTNAQVLGVLRVLRITEHADGISVRPERDAGFATPATLVKQVPGLGLLEVSPRTDRHPLPAWSGLAAAGGAEVFRDRLPDGRPYFVLAAAATWTTVVPLADCSPDRVLSLLSGLSVRAAA